MIRNFQKKKRFKKEKRKRRVRTKIEGTASRPRLSVYRSLKHIYVQIVDDEKGVTLLSANDQELKNEEKAVNKNQKEKTDSDAKKAVAKEVGRLIAKKALVQKIDQVVFDRGGSAYHGRVKALAEGAREGGLIF